MTFLIRFGEDWLKYWITHKTIYLGVHQVQEVLETLGGQLVSLAIVSGTCARLCPMPDYRECYSKWPYIITLVQNKAVSLDSNILGFDK